MPNYLRALAMYAPRAWGSTKAIANNRGLAGLAKDYGLPAITGELLGKAANYATGIPEDIIDMATLSTLKKPVTNIYKNVTGLAKPLYLDKVSGKPLLEIASDRTVDAVAPNVEGSTGITPEMAMQGFYEFINPHQVAAARDQQNYAGLQEWFYGSKTPLNQLPNPNRMMPNPPQTMVNNGYRDPRDFTDRYNTPLTPQEEAGYRTWLNTVHPRQRNTRDYDLQGYYKAAVNNVDPKRFKLAVDPEGNLHFDDRFKKPNHYTFSTDSMYSGRDGYYGGQWRELGNNKYSYTVNPSNLYSNAELQDYFNRNEIGNILIDQRGRR